MIRILWMTARSWNWKAAILSAVGRAPIFIVTTARYGLRAMSAAAAAELLFRLVFSGVFAAITQNVRKTRPIWRAFVCISILVPALSLSLDWLVHRAMHTPNLKVGIGASFAISVLTALFDWYSMNRGVLIVGAEGRSFLADLLSMPSVIAAFVTEPLRLFQRRAEPLQAPVGD